MQGTQVRTLFQENSTCCRVAELEDHSYSSSLEPTSHNYQCPRTLEPVLCNKRSHHNEKSTRGNKAAAPAHPN